MVKRVRWCVKVMGAVLLFAPLSFHLASAQEGKAATESKESASDSTTSGVDDFDAAMDLTIEAKDIEQRSKVIELLESAIRKGLPKDDLALAKQLLGSTALERAKLQLQEIVRTRISEPLARRVRSRVLQDLDLAIANDAALGEAYLLKAKLTAAESPSEAKKALDEAITKLDNDREKRAEAYAVRAILQKDFDDKISDLKQALADLPESVEIQQTLFTLLISQGKFEDVYATGKELLEQNEKNPVALQATVSALLEMKKGDEAITLLNERIEAEPDDLTLLNLRGNVYLDVRKFDEAIADGARLVEINTAAIDGYILRAKAYMQRAVDQNAGADSEDLRLARRDIDAALDLRPNLAEGIRLRAAVASQQKRYDEAIQDTTLLAKNSPQNPVWLEHLATLYQLDDRPSSAVKIADQLIDLDRKNWRAHRIRGDAKLSIGDQAGAIEDYKSALSIMKGEKDVEDDRSGLLNNLAWLLATSTEDSLRDAEESIKFGTEACELTEYKAAHILSTLAAGYAEKGDFEEAIKWSSKAVELGANDDHEQLEQLKSELKSYQEKKPWREKQEIKETKPPVIRSDDAVET